MFQSVFTKAALAVAGGALVLTTAAGTAFAAQSAVPAAAPEAPRATVSAPADAEATRLYEGRVISRINLNVRSKPGLNSPVIGSLPPGTIVKIICKVNDDVVDGNPRWYKILFDGGVGWVSARYVENIGEAPRFCS